MAEIKNKIRSTAPSLAELQKKRQELVDSLTQQSAQPQAAQPTANIGRKTATGPKQRLAPAADPAGLLLASAGQQGNGAGATTAAGATMAGLAKMPGAKPQSLPARMPDPQEAGHIAERQQQVGRDMDGARSWLRALEGAKLDTMGGNSGTVSFNGQTYHVDDLASARQQAQAQIDGMKRTYGELSANLTGGAGTDAQGLLEERERLLQQLEDDKPGPMALGLFGAALQQAKNKGVYNRLHELDAQLGFAPQAYSLEDRLGSISDASFQRQGAAYTNAAGMLLSPRGTMSAIGGIGYHATDWDKVQTPEWMQKARDNTLKAADLMDANSSASDAIARAGANAVGNFAIDLSEGAIDLASDAVMNTLLPGSGLAAMGARSFGSGAMEARHKGLSEEKQMLAGAKSAAIEILTEKIGGPFEKIYGKTFMGRAINGFTEQISSRAGQKALKLFADALGEGAEEALSDIFNAVADRLLGLTDEGWEFVKDPEFWKQVLHDALVGGALGAGGGAVSLARGGGNGVTVQQQAEAMARQAMEQTIRQWMGEVATAPNEMTVRSGSAEDAQGGEARGAGDGYDVARSQLIESYRRQIEAKRGKQASLRRLNEINREIQEKSIPDLEESVARLEQMAAEAEARGDLKKRDGILAALEEQRGILRFVSKDDSSPDTMRAREEEASSLDAEIRALEDKIAALDREAAPATPAPAPSPADILARAAQGQTSQQEPAGAAQSTAGAETAPTTRTSGTAQTGVFNNGSQGTETASPAQTLADVAGGRSIDGGAARAYTESGGRARGQSGTAYTNGGKPVGFHWEVWSARDLVASNDANGNANAAYPAEMQPRDRRRTASQMQVQGMARQIRPELLGESPTAQNGAPFVRGDGAVVGGNARTAALQLAYQTGRAGDYARFVQSEAERLGVKGAMPADPVLVRVVDGQQDWGNLAKEMNEQTTAAYSATEQAMVDAEKVGRILELLEPDEDGNINTAADRDFIRGFLQSVPTEERSGLVTKDGLLSQEGLRRAQQAIFAYAYGDAELLDRLAEQTDADAKNIVNALLAAAPSAAQLKSGVESGSYYDLPAVDLVLDAARAYLDARAQGRTVAETQAQGDLFTERQPVQDAMAQFLEDNKRSAKQMRVFFNSLFETARGFGSPDQFGLFGDGDATVENLIEGAKGRYERETGREGPRPERYTDADRALAGRREPGTAERGQEAAPAGNAGADLRGEDAATAAGGDRGTGLSLFDEEPETPAQPAAAEPETAQPAQAPAEQAPAQPAQPETAPAQPAQQSQTAPEAQPARPARPREPGTRAPRPSATGNASKLSYEELGERYGTMEQRSDAARESAVPLQTSDTEHVGETVRTVYESKATPESRLDDIHGAVVDGRFSYVPVGNDVRAKRAEEKLKRDGWQKALTDWTADVRKGKSGPEIVAMGAVLMNNAANSDMDGRQYVDLMADYYELMHRAGQATAAGKILKSLTPEARLYMIEGTVRRMNDDVFAGRTRKAERQAEKAERQAEKAERQGKTVSPWGNIPSDAWAERTGQETAKAIGKNLKAQMKGKTPPKLKSMTQVVQEDITKIVRSYLTKGQKIDARAMENILTEPQFYVDAYEALRDRLSKEAGMSDAEIEALGHEWLDKSLADTLAEMATGQKEIHIDPKLAEEYLGISKLRGEDGRPLSAEQQEQMRADVLDRIYKNIADQIPVGFVEKLNAMRYLNMLGNIKTQVRNVAGNAGMLAIRKAKDKVKASMELAAYAVSGGKYERTTSLFVSPKLAAECAKDFADYKDVALGESKYSMTTSERVEKKIQDKRRIFKASGTWGTDLADSKAKRSAVAKAARHVADALYMPLEGARKATEWTMETGDLIFSKANYADTMAGWLQAHGVKSLADADPELVERARDYAIKQAQEATFRANNALTKWASGISRDAPPLLKGMLNGTVPFVKTPVNVAIQAFDYSPAGVLTTFWKATYGLKSGTATAQDVVESLSKNLTGAGLTALGFLLHRAGRLRTKDDDEKQEAFDKQRGAQDWSLTLPNGDSFTLDWLAPASIPLFMGAVADQVALEDGMSGNELMKILGSLSEPMMQMSMLSGINEAIENSTSYSGELDAVPQMALNGLLSWVSQLGSNSLLRQGEQASEQYRQTYYTDPAGKLPTTVQKQLAKWSGGMPRYDYQQTDYVDAWGRRQEQGPLGKRILQSFVLPWYSSSDRSTPYDEELQRLYSAGYSTVLPKSPGRSDTWKVGGVEMRVAPEDYTDFAIYVGQKKLELIGDFLDSSEYQRLDDEQREAVISKLYEYATFLGRQDYARKQGETYASNEWDKFADMSTAHAADYLAVRSAFNAAIKANKYNAIDALLDTVYWKSPDVVDLLMGDVLRLDDRMAAREAGIPSMLWQEAWDKYKELGDNEDLKPQQRAEQFRKYLSEQPWLSDDQRGVLREQFTFFQMTPANTKHYDALTAAGFDPDKAISLRERVAALEPVGDAKGVAQWQEVEAIVSMKGLTDEEKWAALEEYLNKDTYAKAQAYREKGMDPDDWAAQYIAKSKK